MPCEGFFWKNSSLASSSAVLRADPAQVAALGAAGAIGQLAGQFGESARRRVSPGQLQKGLLGPHRQGIHVQAIRHRKEDVAQVDLAAFKKRCLFES